MFASLAASVLVGVGQAQEVYSGQIGKPYLLGTVSYGPGNQPMDNGNSRLVTMKGVKSTLAASDPHDVFVAGEGKKLVLIRAVIKNPEKKPIEVNGGKSFGVRLLKPTFAAVECKFLKVIGPKGELIEADLAPGKEIEVVSVFEMPALTPTLTIALWFHKYYADKNPRFDLSKSFDPPTSVFAKSALEYMSSAEVPVGKEFDLDAYSVKVLGNGKASDGAVVVRVQVRNTMAKDLPFGWQYFAAELVHEKSKPTAAYPDFYIDEEFKDWGFTIKPGRSVTGEYRFYPSGGDAIQAVRLTSNATKRFVTVQIPRESN